jgi:hypothetical protein
MSFRSGVDTIKLCLSSFSDCCFYAFSLYKKENHTNTIQWSSLTGKNGKNACIKKIKGGNAGVSNTNIFNGYTCNNVPMITV